MRLRRDFALVALCAKYGLWKFEYFLPADNLVLVLVSLSLMVTRTVPILINFNEVEIGAALISDYSLNENQVLS